MLEDILGKVTNFFKEKETDALRERRVLWVCMGLSLLIWFFVKMSQDYESRGGLLMKYELPMGYTFAAEPRSSLSIKFAGTGWKLLYMGLLRQKPSLSFKLVAAQSQVISRADISQKIEQALKLKLIELEVDNVGIQLDSLFSKKVAVELDTSIRFENGYYFRENISLSPDSVVVFGAPQLLQDIKGIKTELLKMECPETDFTKQLKLVNPKPGLLELSSKVTELLMPVEQYTEKTLTVPITVFNERDSVRLLPYSVELRCVVGISRFKSVTASDFRVVAVIDTSTATSTVPLALVRQPSWVKSARFSPQDVEYLIVQ
ncbi:MAG: hypothetical protein MUC59_04465 [Saprospiraceae bacterium]|nr:hypothetical protein [Saprospiraceae bacterium]